MKRTELAAVLAALTLAACNDAAGPQDMDPAPAFAAGGGYAGSVYTMSNDAAANEVLAYRRAADGSLSFQAAFATGGSGSGGGLGNQGGLVLTGNGRTLLVVNAGSNDISVFRRSNDGTLGLTDREPSGGTLPISVTVRDNAVYVLNAGGAGGIAGFRLSPQGDLSAVAGSAQPLSSAAPGPAQIEFAPNGRFLVVTEKNTNQIVVYPVSQGVAGPGVVNPSQGATPFGFGFDTRGHLLVSNAAGGAADAGSMSSYRIGNAGNLIGLDTDVPNTESAPCWVVVTRDGRFAYTTNTASGTTSGYAVRPEMLTLLDADGVTGTNTGAPIDAALSRHGGQVFLYVLNGGGAAIDGFAVNHDGSLSPVAGGVVGLPAGTNGLAAS
jgi:6-phosphogluconolactonase (cycloisomerase 2 family)